MYNVEHALIFFVKYRFQLFGRHVQFHSKVFLEILHNWPIAPKTNPYKTPFRFVPHVSKRLKESPRSLIHLSCVQKTRRSNCLSPTANQLSFDQQSFGQFTNISKTSTAVKKCCVQKIVQAESCLNISISNPHAN